MIHPKPYSIYLTGTISNPQHHLMMGGQCCTHEEAGGQLVLLCSHGMAKRVNVFKLHVPSNCSSCKNTHPNPSISVEARRSTDTPKPSPVCSLRQAERLASLKAIF